MKQNSRASLNKQPLLVVTSIKYLLFLCLSNSLIHGTVMFSRTLFSCLASVLEVVKKPKIQFLDIWAETRFYENSLIMSSDEISETVSYFINDGWIFKNNVLFF